MALAGDLNTVKKRRLADRMAENTALNWFRRGKISADDISHDRAHQIQLSCLDRDGKRR